MVSPFLFLFLIGSFLSGLYGVLSPYRDSGDLVSSAFSLGIAHPPGYALYSIVTKVGMLAFPFANPAYRANLLSALWTAGAATLVFSILRRRAGGIPSLLAVLIWSFSPASVELSRVSEMYTLNALLCGSVLACVFKAGDSDDETMALRFYWLGWFMNGLSLLNHPTMLFLFPGLIAFGWMRFGWKSPLQALAFPACFAAAGYSLVLFYPLRSLREPWLDWGNPESPRALWRLLTRADYGGLKLHPEESQLRWTAGQVWEQARLFARAEWGEIKIWGTGAALLGFWASSRKPDRKERARNVFLAVSFLLTGPAFVVLSNLPIGEETTLPILEPYFIMANFLLVPWMAAGLGWLWDQVRGPRFAKNSLGAVLSGLLVFYVWPGSRRNKFQAYDYGRNLLHALPPRSSLYEPDDGTAFALSYLQTVEKRRPDVAVLMTLRTFWGYEELKKRRPDVVPPGPFGSAQEFIPALLRYQGTAGRPLLADHPSKFPQGMENHPRGILYRAGSSRDEAALEESRAILQFSIERGGFSERAVDRAPEFFTRHLLSRYSAAWNNLGIEYQSRKEFDRAGECFQEALRRDPRLLQAWNNWGVNEILRGRAARAEEVFKEANRKTGGRDSFYYYLALSQKNLGKDSESGASLERALELNPRHSGAMNERGLLALKRGQWEPARQWFEKAVAADPGFAAGHYNLGLALRSLGKKRQAADAFRKYLEMDPGARDRPQVEIWIRELSI